MCLHLSGLCACNLTCLEHFQDSVCPRGLRGFCSGAVIPGRGGFCPLHVPSAARCTTQHTHTHASTETNTSKHRYVVTYHMGRARGARFQGLSHRKWETRSEFSSSFQTNDPCSIVEHSPFPIMLTFATKVFTSLMKLLPLSQGITYLCISAADHSKQNLWVLE